MSESSVIEDLVEQIKKKKTKMPKISKSGKSSRSSRSHRRSHNTSSDHQSGGSKKKKGLFGGILGDLGKNKMFLIGLALLLVVGIFYYLKKKKKKTSEKQPAKNEINNDHMDKVKEILDKRAKYDQENNIVRLKLPERYLTDESGKPVVLTPEILESIKQQPIKLNKDQQRQQQQQQQQQQRQQKKTINTEDSFVEDDNINRQNLTKEEMEEIKNELELMDNQIVPSNS